MATLVQFNPYRKRTYHYAVDDTGLVLTDISGALIRSNGDHYLQLGYNQTLRYIVIKNDWLWLSLDPADDWPTPPNSD